MPTALDDLIVEIEHDHTQLTVLFEDLQAIAAQAQQFPEELLEDSRHQWQLVQDGIVDHFHGEESRVFGALARRFPDQQTLIGTLQQQHRALEHRLTELGALLLIPGMLPASSPLWAAFSALWSHHSELEWQLIQTVRTRLEQTARDASRSAP